MRSGSLFDRVVAFLAVRTSVRPGARLLVAVSGGIDSVVLAHVLVQAGFRIVVAHVDHGLRGDASREDARFVEELAATLSVPFRQVTLPDGWQIKGSLQDRARSLRYEALEALAAAEGIPYVAAGHHRDDQAETVLLSLSRGTGPEGLAGMRAERPLGRVQLVRPLLEESRAAIRAYAADGHIAWREDATNGTDAYRRNALRHTVLPAFGQAVGGDVIDRIARSAALVGAYVDAETGPIAAVLVDVATRPLPAGGREVPLEVLERLPPVWARRLLLEVISREFASAPRDRILADRLMGLVASPVSRRVPVEGGAVWREREGLAFAHHIPVPEARSVVPGDRVAWGGRVIRLDQVPCRPVHGEGPYGRSLCLAPGRLAGDWTVRAWTAGDAMRPAGGRGRRKVKDLLTDARVPAHFRHAAPVLEAGGKVVAVIGVRCDVSAVPADDREAVIEIRLDDEATTVAVS